MLTAADDRLFSITEEDVMVGVMFALGIILGVVIAALLLAAHRMLACPARRAIMLYTPHMRQCGRIGLHGAVSCSLPPCVISERYQ